MDFDVKRLNLGEQIAAGGAIALFIFFFFFHWYGVSFSTSIGTISGGVNGWHAHTFLRWLILLTIIGGLGLGFMKATSQKPALPAAPELILLVLAGLTTLFVLYRMFIDQPGPDKLVELQAGAYLGLISLIAITVGAWLAMGEEGTAALKGMAKRSSAPAPPAPAPSAPPPAPPVTPPPAPDPGPPAAAAPAPPPPQTPQVGPTDTTPTGS